MRLGDAGISGDAQLLKEFTAHVNQINSLVWHWIFMSYGGWEYDDSNQSDLPIATAGLTADQQTYALPSTALTVRGIEIKDASGVWSEMHPVNEEQIRDLEAVAEFNNDSGIPKYYQLLGSTIKFFPPPNYTQASSLKVYFDRGSVAFASTDEAKTPGFASEYHNAVPVGASLEALSIEQPDNTQVQWLAKRFAEYEVNIKNYYSRKFQQMFPPKFTVRDQMRQYV